jgi:hypothetical protein
MNVNDHALALLRACPEPLGDVAMEICQSMGVQPWHFIVGHLVKADQRAELHAPLLLPEWTDRSETPTVVAGRKCRCCGLPLTEKTRAGAEYCCNFCGSGRFTKEQVHHPACEHYITPRRVLQRNLGIKVEVGPPPTDPSARAQYEKEAFERHLRESVAAETAPGGLPPEPDTEVAQAGRGAGDWA